MGQLQPLEDLRRRCEHADIPLQFWQMINETATVEKSNLSVAFRASCILLLAIYLLRFLGIG
jgi:ABC-type phosphate transport system permease subunit